MADLEKKYGRLQRLLKELGKIVIGFSGGVDSTFLLKAARDAVDEDILAVTVITPYIPRWEIEEAKRLADLIGVRHELIEIPVLDAIRHNPENRCYLCKRELFENVLSLTRAEGYDCVIDGTNADDKSDYRPGMMALKELEVRSPLLECEMTKGDIRELSARLGLPTWDKPAYACLLTRIPYHRELREGDFLRIEKAEIFMMERGFRAVRVRIHEDLARIEVDRTDRERLFDTALFDEISEGLKALGFRYVTLDMTGYRMGSFNDRLKGK